jgi:hypothetical protein
MTHMTFFGRYFLICPGISLYKVQAASLAKETLLPPYKAILHY